MYSSQALLLLPKAMMIKNKNRYDGEALCIGIHDKPELYHTCYKNELLCICMWQRSIPREIKNEGYILLHAQISDLLTCPRQQILVSPALLNTILNIAFFSSFLKHPRNVPSESE